MGGNIGVAMIVGVELMKTFNLSTKATNHSLEVI
jgi:hypothetical protein